jgi:hypothetical protein
VIFSILLVALSVSIGWGVRGQFGHEYGAALAGALGGMAVAIASGRPDWVRRVHYCAMFAAIGWAFGGSMSYMKTLAYTHSSDPATVLYGFACLFVIGFAWAAPGGAGAALPFSIDREELTKFFGPLCAVFFAWYLQGVFRNSVRLAAGSEASAVLALIVVLLFAVFRRRSLGIGTSLIVYMATGWLSGYLLFNVALKLKMHPPREDEWGPCLGMIAGILVFCWRQRLAGIAFATLTTGFLGGIGFSLGQAIRLSGMSTGRSANWHSVLEQTQGFFHGVALAVAMSLLARRAPKVTDEPQVRRWTEVASVVFVLGIVIYLNFRKSVAEWVHYIPTFTPDLYGIRAGTWFNMIFGAIALAMTGLLILHLRRPVAFIPATWLGKGQLLYLVFLWSIVTMNFMHVLPRFAPGRLATEWVITLNAVICTILVVAFPASSRAIEPRSYSTWIRNTVLLGLIGAITATFVGWGVKRALFGDRPVGDQRVDQIRFGPNNTNTVK